MTVALIEATIGSVSASTCRLAWNAPEDEARPWDLRSTARWKSGVPGDMSIRPRKRDRRKQGRRHNNPVPEKLRRLAVCCPKCFCPMKLRHSRFGPFFGCSRYPPCMGIRTPENACDLATFPEALEQVLYPPLNTEDILFNPDAPSFVWY